MQLFLKRLGIATVLFLWLLLAYTDSFAGAWVPPKDTGVIIISTTNSDGTSRYDVSGDLTGSIGFKKTESVYYLERGLGKRLAVIGSASLQSQAIRTEFGFDKYFGLGEAALGLRYKVKDFGAFTVSVQPSVFYTGQNEKYSTLVRESKTPSAELRGLIGYGLHKGNVSGFIDLQAARRFGFQIIPNEWRIDATLGVRPVEKLELLTQAFWSKSEVLDNAPRLALPTESLKGQFSIIYHKNDAMAYQIGIGRTLRGTSVIREDTLTAGIWRKF